MSGTGNGAAEAGAGGGEEEARRSAAAMAAEAGGGGQDGGGGGEVDREEEAFEAGARRRDGQAGHRIQRLLRDRHILRNELFETKEQLAAERAARAKRDLEGYGVELTRAEADAQAAVEAGDPAAVARANRRMAELAAGRTAAAYEQRSADAAVVEVQREAKEAAGSGRSEVTEEWLGANGWYGQDRTMTRQAQTLHAEALEEGYSAELPAYWRHIESGMEARFPGKVRALYLKADGGGGNRSGTARAGNGAAGDHDDDLDEGPARGARRADPAASARVPADRASGAVLASRGGGGPAAGSPAALERTLSAAALEVAKSLNLTPGQYAARVSALVGQGRVSLKNITGG